MKLDAINRVLFVLECHDESVFGAGGDLQIFRPGFFGDDEGVVAHGFAGVFYVAEDALFGVVDGAGFAVHDDGCADDFAAEGVGDALVSEADAEEGCVFSQFEYCFEADAKVVGVFRASWSGGEDDVCGVEAADFGEGDFVVAEYDGVAFEFADVLNDVEGEGVVVVDDEGFEFQGEGAR